MKKITQTILFQASAHDVFELLMNSSKHAAFTGEAATISRKVGGTFTAYGEYITGENVEIVKDSKIVQKWRAADWPEGVFSIVTFSIAIVPGNGSKLVFTQEGVPDDQFESIKQGWNDFYWDPMKEYLGED